MVPSNTAFLFVTLVFWMFGGDTLFVRELDVLSIDASIILVVLIVILYFAF